MIICLSMLGTFSACAARDHAAIRRSHTEQMLAEREARTTAEVPASGRLGHDDCIRIALSHNLDIRYAAVEKRIAGLERQIAFANFLPVIEADVSWSRLRNQPHTDIAGMLVPIADRRVRETALSLRQPIFAPYTWFLYSMFRKGEDISRLVALRTRQQIAYEISALYFRCLTIRQAKKFLDTAVQRARAVVHEVSQQHRFGLVRAGDLAEAEALLMSREYEVRENGRRLRIALSDLLDAMGLDPRAPLQLNDDAPLERPEGCFEDLLAEALFSRPELRMHDLRYDIARDKIKTALTEFLPELFGFASLSHTTDSFVRYGTQWLGGLGGVMTVFNGFADINAYRAARARAEEAFIKREQACLTVMLQVQQAYLSVDSAEEARRVAEKLLCAREEKLREQTEAWKQGLLQLSDRLAALSRRDEARMLYEAAQYRHQIACASLFNVIGSTGSSIHQHETSIPEDRHE